MTSDIVDGLEELLQGGIWRVPNVQDQPSIRLYDWTIKRATDGCCYFVGTLEGEGTGRVSTKIVAFNKESMIGRTSSGRTYQLLGRSGHSADGEHVWRHFKRINQVTEVEETIEGEDEEKSLDFVRSKAKLGI